MTVVSKAVESFHKTFSPNRHNFGHYSTAVCCLEVNYQWPFLITKARGTFNDPMTFQDAICFGAHLLLTCPNSIQGIPDDQMQFLPDLRFVANPVYLFAVAVVLLAFPQVAEDLREELCGGYLVDAICAI